MEEKIIKIKKAQPARKFEVIVYICDICGEKSQRKMKTCFLCGRMICNYSRCFEYVYNNENSDYPDKYCKHCYDLKFIKYKNNYLELEKTYDNHYAILENKIREESLERKL